MQYGNKEFLGAPLSHSDITRDDNSSVSKLNISLSNVALAISGIVGNRGDVITNANAVLALVFLDVNTNTLIPNLQQILTSNLVLVFVFADVLPTLRAFFFDTS